MRDLLLLLLVSVVATAAVVFLLGALGMIPGAPYVFARKREGGTDEAE